MNLTLTQLKYCIEVYRQKSFGEAARFCCVSQPTLSLQIQKMESAIGVKIFDRSKKPVEPTRLGLKVIERAQRVLDEVSQINSMLQKEKGDIVGEFEWGVLPTLAPYVVPFFLEKFAACYPKVDLIVHELQTDQILEKLRKGYLDAGLVVTPLQQEGIFERKLFCEELFVYVHPDHKLTQKKSIHQKDLNANEVWLLSDKHCFHSQVIEVCQGHTEGERKNFIFEPENLETLMQLVDQTSGYALIPELAIQSIISKEKKDCIKPITSPKPLVRQVSLIYSRSVLKLDIIECIEKEILSHIPLSIKGEEDAKVVPIIR